MEEHGIEKSEERSLEEFKQNVLGSMNKSEFGDSFSTVAPDSSTVCAEYNDDQFEGIFYKTLREETCISVNFVSNVFLNSFQSKFLSDFSNSIDSDESRRVFKCTTHVKSLRCDLKLDGNSRNVTVSGVGRIVWRKDYFSKITRFIFKQYVQTSGSQLESQLENNNCDILTAEKSVQEDRPPVSTAPVVFSSTPLISRKDSQPNNGENSIQPPLFNSTPIVPGMETQTAGRRMNSQQTATLDTMTTVKGSESQVCVPSTDTEVTNIEASTCMQQPMYVIRDEIRNQPFYALSNPIGPRNFVDGTIIPPPIYTAIPMTETHLGENGVSWPTGYQPNFHYMPMMPVIPGTDFQPQGETEGPTFSHVQNVPEIEPRRCTSDVTAQTIKAIIQRLKGLESQVNNTKNSIITSVESKLQEMKTSLVSIIDNMASKTYSEAVQRRQVSIDSSSVDEGYFNNSRICTSGDSSQTLLKTVFSQNTATTTTTEDKRRTPTKRIPVRVTNRPMIRDENREGRSQQMTENTSGVPTEFIQHLQRKH